jgi:hypothetical protein
MRIHRLQVTGQLWEYAAHSSVQLWTVVHCNIKEKRDLNFLCYGLECLVKVFYVFSSRYSTTKCSFLCVFYSFLFVALHVSGAIRTHPQEHNCSVQPYLCVSVEGRGCNSVQRCGVIFCMN